MPQSFELFTIYDRPSDYPDECVVRVSRIGRGTVEPGEIIARGPTVKAAREALFALRPGLNEWPTFAGDDPVIAEVWGP